VLRSAPHFWLASKSCFGERKNEKVVRARKENKAPEHKSTQTLSIKTIPQRVLFRPKAGTTLALKPNRAVVSFCFRLSRPHEKDEATPGKGSP
jgi:hypothetical protein